MGENSLLIGNLLDLDESMYIELFKLFEKIDELKGDIGELETTV